jgi:APA family basic amino acid/polyamine antiporter
VLPILGVLTNGYMMYKLGWINWARLFGWLIIGLVVYFTYGRKHSRVARLADAPAQAPKTPVVR